MADKNIPNDVKQFLLENIDSISQWEGLLLLIGKPEKMWDAEEVSRNLYITKEEAVHLLLHLEARMLIAVTQTQGGFLCRYRPRTPEADVLIKRAAEFYGRSVIPITNIIHSKPKSRVQQFADAFRVRKD